MKNKEEPVKISDILKTSSEGEVYHIFLGEDSKITARREKGNERHYDFTGSGSSEMTINWQAEDSEGNSIDSSMTIEVGSDGIQKVIGDPKFGGMADRGRKHVVAIKGGEGLSNTTVVILNICDNGATCFDWIQTPECLCKPVLYNA